MATEKILPRQFFTLPQGTGEDTPSIKLPPGFWRLNFCRGNITTDATVANRAPLLTFHRQGSGRVPIAAGGDIGANLETEFAMVADLPRASLGTNSPWVCGPVSTVTIPGESTITFQLCTGQSGDLVTGLELEFERVA